VSNALYVLVKMRIVDGTPI